MRPEGRVSCGVRRFLASMDAKDEDFSAAVRGKTSCGKGGGQARIEARRFYLGDVKSASKFLDLRREYDDIVVNILSVVGQGDAGVVSLGEGDLVATRFELRDELRMRSRQGEVVPEHECVCRVLLCPDAAHKGCREANGLEEGATGNTPHAWPDFEIDVSHCHQARLKSSSAICIHALKFHSFLVPGLMNKHIVKHIVPCARLSPD